jgi:hypothetical protein
LADTSRHGVDIVRLGAILVVCFKAVSVSAAGPSSFAPRSIARMIAAARLRSRESCSVLFTVALASSMVACARWCELSRGAA